jgi:hypothetical protein
VVVVIDSVIAETSCCRVPTILAPDQAVGISHRVMAVAVQGAPPVMNDFAISSPKTSIRTEICRFLKTVHQFEYQDNDVILTKIIDLIRQNCDSI